MTWKIKQIGKAKINNSVLIEGLPGMGNVGKIIVASGGTDHTSATILVWLNGIIAFAFVYCFFMWIASWVRARKSE